MTVLYSLQWRRLYNNGPLEYTKGNNEMTTTYQIIGKGTDKDRYLTITKAHANLSPKPFEACVFYSLDTHVSLNEETQEYDAFVTVVWKAFNENEE